MSQPVVSLVRRLSKSGTLTIPVEIRRAINLHPKMPVEIRVTSDRKMLIGPYQNGCVICGEAEKLRKLKGKHVCDSCVQSLLNN